MSYKKTWVERAEFVDGDRRILGELDDGSWWCPSRTDPRRWDRRFSPWRPTHWRFWLRSRLTGRMAWLERWGDIT